MNRKKIWEKKKNFSRKKSIQKPKKKSIREFQKLGLIKEGTFIGNHKGFGFVELEEEEDDIFIPADATGTAMHQDKVQIIKKKGEQKGKRKEGSVIRILERANQEIVGTFQRERDYGFIICDNQKFSKDVYVSPKNSKGVRDGDKVVAEILDYGDDRHKPEGRIKENLGSMNAPGTDILAIVKSYNIPSEFPVKVMNQAARVPDHVLEADRDGRMDLTDWQTVTIDGEDAKDLDDAVTLTKEDNIYHLGVHIADVSHYVREKTELDKEAYLRGTSIYMLGRVIPMLPRELSNGICSLNAGEDRYTLSCSMEITPKAKIVSSDIYKGVICVTERMCYTDVQKILDRSDETVLKRYEKYISYFDLMAELANILKAKRKENGYLNLEIPESKIILDENGVAIDVKKYETYFANEIIEQFMLIANETVAEKFYWLQAPFIYRNHEAPDVDKVKELNKSLYNFGYKIKISKEEIIYPNEFAKILEDVKGKDEEKVVSNIIFWN